MVRLEPSYLLKKPVVFLRLVAKTIATNKARQKALFILEMEFRDFNYNLSNRYFVTFLII